MTERWRPALVLAVTVVTSAMLLAGCRDEGDAASGESALPILPRFGEPIPTPVAADVGAHCADVRDRRVCWSEGEARVVARPVPESPAPADAFYRCDGMGDARRCWLERRRPFNCTGGVCSQPYPRLPNDGETECADVSGVVICRTRSHAAGVAEGPEAGGWICRGETPRICVDLSPDLPREKELEQEDEMATPACRFHHQGGFRRECAVDGGPAAARAGLRLGQACDGPCAEGLSCVQGRCAPTRYPRAECWTSEDCDEGRRCELSTCLGEGA